MEQTKKCSKCGEVKGLDEFHRFKHGKDGRKPRCKLCNTADANAYAAANKKRSTQKKMDWYRRQPETYRKARETASNRRRSSLMPDSYIATCVARQSMSASDVPPELIALKREQLAIKRMARELKKAATKPTGEPE